MRSLRRIETGTGAARVRCGSGCPGYGQALDTWLSGYGQSVWCASLKLSTSGSCARWCCGVLQNLVAVYLSAGGLCRRLRTAVPSSLWTPALSPRGRPTRPSVGMDRGTGWGSAAWWLSTCRPAVVVVVFGRRRRRRPTSRRVLRALLHRVSLSMPTGGPVDQPRGDGAVVFMDAGDGDRLSPWRRIPVE